MPSSHYTVKQVAELTGVPAATLRAWERRYAVVSPRRSESRYRLYDQGEVALLSRMAELVRRGSPASLAAEHVLATVDSVVGGTNGLARSGFGAVVAGMSRGQAPFDGPDVATLLEAARTYDLALLTRLLDEAMSTVSFEVAASEWLMPALHEVGEAWELGELDVAGEHFVSAAVHHRLATAFDAAGPNTGAPVCIVGLPAGSLHALGGLAFAVCLRRQAIDVRFLGADVPHDSWRHTLDQLLPAGVVVGVPTTQDADEACSLMADLLAEHADLRMWLGGRGAAAALDRLGGESLDAHGLPDSVVEAADHVAQALHQRTSRS